MKGVPVPIVPKRHYPNEEARQHAERRQERIRLANRQASAMFMLMLAQAGLESSDALQSDKYVSDLAMSDGQLVATIAKRDFSKD